MRARFSQILGAASVLTAATSSLSPASAADQIFLKIEGVTGEVADAKHKGEIQIENFSLGLSNSRSNSGGGSTKPSFNDLVTGSIVSKASPVLSYFCASGKHIPTATLTVRKSGDNPVEFYTVKLEDVTITSVSTGFSADPTSTSTESYSFSYSKITWTYIPVGNDGKAQAPVSNYFDVLKNKGG